MTERPVKSSYLHVTAIDVGLPLDLALALDEVVDQSEDMIRVIEAAEGSDSFPKLYFFLIDLEIAASELAHHCRQLVRVCAKTFRLSGHRLSQVAEAALAYPTGESPKGGAWPQGPRFFHLRMATLNVRRAAEPFAALVGAGVDRLAPLAEPSSGALFDLAVKSHLLDVTARELSTEARRAARLAQLSPSLSREVEASLVEEYKADLASRPGDPELWLDLAESYVALGRLDDASSAIEKALHLNPNKVFEAYGLFLKGKVAHAQGDETAALSFLRRSFELDPPCAEEQVILAEVLLACGESQEAVQVLAEALALDPADPEALRLQYRMPGLQARERP